MNLKALRPSGPREWSLTGIGALAALLALLVAFPRYREVPLGHADGGVPIFLLVDRWTGGMQTCSNYCYPVHFQPPAPAAAN